MANTNTSTLSERLDGYQVVQDCCDQIIDMTIGDYFSGCEDKLEEYLELPSSKKWHLTANAPLAVLTLADDMDIPGSDEFVKNNHNRALDLMAHPVEASNYRLPIFRFSNRGFMNYMEKNLKSEFFLDANKEYLEKMKGLSDKTLNQTFRYFNTSSEDSKYDWLWYVFSGVFSNLWKYFDLKGRTLKL